MANLLGGLLDCCFGCMVGYCALLRSCGSVNSVAMIPVFVYMVILFVWSVCVMVVLLFGYVVCMGSIVGFPRLGCGGF